jgi:hypothetical protein
MSAQSIMAKALVAASMQGHLLGVMSAANCLLDASQLQGLAERERRCLVEAASLLIAFHGALAAEARKAGDIPA